MTTLLYETLKAITEALKCPLCSESFQLEDFVPMVLPCGHSICLKCLWKAEEEENCPDCQEGFSRRTHAYRNETLCLIIEKLAEKKSCFLDMEPEKTLCSRAKESIFIEGDIKNKEIVIHPFESASKKAEKKEKVQKRNEGLEGSLNRKRQNLGEDDNEEYDGELLQQISNIYNRKKMKGNVETDIGETQNYLIEACKAFAKAAFEAESRDK